MLNIIFVCVMFLFFFMWHFDPTPCHGFPLWGFMITLIDNIQHSQETNIHPPGGIQTHNPCKRAATDPHLRPHGHWDRPVTIFLCNL